jgi:HAD superfamily hydrolase (TIGR01509 family)
MDQRPRQELAARLGINLYALYDLVFTSETARQATLGEISANQHWEAVGRRFDLDGKGLEDLIRQFWEGDRLDRSLLDYIKSLRPRHKTVLLSNAWDNLRGLLEDEWKIAGAFDELVISAEVALAKPDHRIYLLTLVRLGITPPQAVFVDDFGENVDAARWIGMRAVHFHSVTQALAELERILWTSPN